jgi:hypothetical protein
LVRSCNPFEHIYGEIKSWHRGKPHAKASS